MRKAIVLVLLTVLLVSCIPVQAQAAYENTYVNTGDQRADIIGVALTQLGYQEGKGTGVWNNDTKYGDWAGYPKTEWCGWFVSWCARQADIPTSVIRTNGLAKASSFGLTSYYTSDQYTPRPGDLFFKKNWGHVGIVYYVEGSYFYTLEGNTSTSTWEGTSVMSRRRALSEFYFAPPAYTSDSGSSVTPPAHTHNYEQGYESSHPHKEYMKCACGESYYTGNTRTVSSCSSCAQSSCSHSYGSWSSAGNSNHQKSCTKCGYRQTQSHQWQDHEITKEPTCKEAGVLTQRCSTCNATRTQKLDKLEEHIFKDWIVGDESNHMRVCEYCDEEQVAPHQLMVDDQDEPIWHTDEQWHWYQCADCGKKIQATEHILKTDKDQEGHWQFCQVCQQTVAKQAHVYDHGCDQACDDCGHTRKTEHVYTGEVLKDGVNHWFACENCGERKDVQTHKYQLSDWEEGSKVENCSVCGYLSGRVVVQSDWEKFLGNAKASLTALGKMILPMQLEAKWYLIAGGTVCALVPVILVVAICLIVRAVRKHKRQKLAV